MNLLSGKEAANYGAEIIGIRPEHFTVKSSLAYGRV